MAVSVILTRPYCKLCIPMAHSQNNAHVLSLICRRWNVYVSCSFGLRAIIMGFRPAGTPTAKPNSEEKLRNEVLCWTDRLGASRMHHIPGSMRVNLVTVPLCLLAVLGFRRQFCYSAHANLDLEAKQTGRCHKRAEVNLVTVLLCLLGVLGFR